MKSFTFVEIDVDKCTRVYGSSPCTAAVGVTGTRKCYNTLATCQDTANYEAEPQTLRFAVPTDELSFADDASAPAIPSIVSVSHTPARIRLGEDLGERASVSVVFTDHPDSDLSMDPYISERPNPAGTFWGRFRARHKYVLGRPLRWINQYVGGAEFGGTETPLVWGSEVVVWNTEEVVFVVQNRQVRNYIIEAINGPDVSGKVSIVAKDVLKLADGTRAQVPKLSTGTLAADITDTDTALVLSPAGIGDLEYDGVELIAINDEVMRVTARSGNSFTVERAAEFTEATEHEEGDSVQAVKVYSGMRASDIVYDLLVNEAKVPASVIDLSKWTSDYDLFINRLYSARIADPAPARQLISELMEQAGFSLFVDEIANQIRFVPLRALATPGFTINDDLMVANSLGYSDQPDRRISQVWVYYGQRNPLEKLDEQKNYSVASLDIDLAAESPDQYGQAAIRKIYSRWIPRLLPDNAKAAADLLIERFRNAPQNFRFQLQVPESRSTPDIGQSINLFSRVIQDDAGNQISVPVTIVSRRDDWRGYSFEGEEFRIQPLDPDAPDEITLPDFDETATSNLVLRDIYDASRALPPTADTNITFVVPSTVTVGGVVAGPSLLTGDWPTGATITLINNGKILGRGGDGGFTSDAITQSNGGPGSTAFKATFPITIINNSLIGGGGGGGALGPTNLGPLAFPGGGGGGAGRTNGIGGAYYFDTLAILQGENGTDTDGGAGGGFLAVGGDGGDLGQAGASTTTSSGGAAGAAIEGSAFVTLSVAGDIRGAQI